MELVASKKSWGVQTTMSICRDNLFNTTRFMVTDQERIPSCLHYSLRYWDLWLQRGGWCLTSQFQVHNSYLTSTAAPNTHPDLAALVSPGLSPSLISQTHCWSPCSYYLSSSPSWKTKVWAQDNLFPTMTDMFHYYSADRPLIFFLVWLHHFSIVAADQEVHHH